MFLWADCVFTAGLETIFFPGMDLQIECYNEDQFCPCFSHDEVVLGGSRIHPFNRTICGQPRSIISTSCTLSSCRASNTLATTHI